MSRIAGLVVPDKQPGAGNIQRMLEAMKTVPSWGVVAGSIGTVSAGFVGEEQGRIAQERNVLAVIDGHIYNHDEWGQNSAAELLLELYRQHGFEGAVSRLNGDFAVVLYDQEKDELWCARDRVGLKPFYYSYEQGVFACSSRINGLLAVPGMKIEPRRDFVARFAGGHYRYFDYEQDRSPFEGIAQLPAGNILRLKNGLVKVSRYWKMEDRPDLVGSFEELAGEYRDLLIDSVRLRFRSAGNIGFTLSGGMDSSSVLASAVRITGNRQPAFSSVYADKTYDETDEIKSMLDSCVQQWHKVLVHEPDVFLLVRQMVKVHDEPVATATWLSHFILCQQASGLGFKSLFGGMGGDELNAGEYDHFLYFFADLRASGEEERLRQEIGMWQKYHDHPLYKKNAQVVESNFQRLVDFKHPGRCLPDKRRIAWYAQALSPEFSGSLKRFDPVMEHPFSSYLKNRTYQDMMFETIPCCVRAEDRQGMAFGVEHFLPFFDYRLIEFMFRVPSRLKYKNGVTKALLREAMKGILPEETRQRVKKTGWNAPAHIWFSGSGASTVRDLVRSKFFRALGIYKLAEVEKLLDEHEKIVSGGLLRENHMMFFWQLTNLVLWLEHVENVQIALKRNRT
jgi:asparagine synthase (glutamine-hydrolysing)